MKKYLPLICGISGEKLTTEEIKFFRDYKPWGIILFERNCINKDNLKPITFTSHSYKEFHLLMPLYLCKEWNGEVRPMEGQEIKWIEPEAITKYPMPPADKPLIKNLLKWLENQC